MIPKRSLLAIALFLLFPPILAAEDEVVGTLTVHGKTTTLNHVYASLETESGQPDEKYLVLLMSDAPLSEGDRSSGHLASLAKQEQIHALKVRWHVGYDGLDVVPYHAGIPESGATVRGLGMIDLQQFDDKKVAVKLGSHKLGQDWHYSARVRANLRQGGTVEIEPDAELVAVSPVPQPGEVGDPLLAIKKELGTLKYEFNAENFLRAVKDGNVPAVKLFLKAGMSANTKDGDQHAMVMGAMFCAYDPKPVRDEVVLALLKAKGNPNAADDNNATALLWAAENCGAEVIRAMIQAGGNVNARAKGGGTPLMMAEAFKRSEIAGILREAGAKP